MGSGQISISVRDFFLLRWRLLIEVLQRAACACSCTGSVFLLHLVFNMFAMDVGFVTFAHRHRERV
jgi:hypothetical protein